MTLVLEAESNRELAEFVVALEKSSMPTTPAIASPVKRGRGRPKGSKSSKRPQHTPWHKEDVQAIIEMIHGFGEKMPKGYSLKVFNHIKRNGKFKRHTKNSVVSLAGEVKRYMLKGDTREVPQHVIKAVDASGYGKVQTNTALNRPSLLEDPRTNVLPQHQPEEA